MFGKLDGQGPENRLSRLDAPVDIDRLDVRFVLDEDETTREDAGAEGDRALRLDGTSAYARYLERAQAWRPEGR